MPCTPQLYHTGVYRRDMPLTAGQTYNFQTTNLRHVWFLQSAAADPVMYLVNSNEDIVAFNDDYIGLASQIIYTPNQTDTYTLIIRAYSTKTPGTCDLYQGIGGANPTLLERDVYFNGTRVDAGWNAGDSLTTINSTGDPYLYAIIGNKMYRNDDGAGYPNSRIVLLAAGQGTVIVGSYTRSREGICNLCLTSSAGPVYLNPYQSPTPSVPEERRAPLSREMKKFIEELERAKPSLEELEPAERDRRVLELERNILSEEEQFESFRGLPEATVDFIRCQQNFLRRYEAMEQDLQKMSYVERSQTLAQLKEQIVGPAHNVEKPNNLLNLSFR